MIHKQMFAGSSGDRENFDQMALLGSTTPSSYFPSRGDSSLLEQAFYLKFF